MTTFEGDLVLKEDTVFDENIEVNGNIICEGGTWNIKAWNIEAWNIKARNIEAWGIEAWGIEAWNIEFYAYCISFSSLKCKSWKGIRKNHIIKCLDKEIEIL